jgi:tRNA (guanine-N7-)-methyltransferase
MGRRALPKVDPDLNLERNLYSLEALPRPWSPEQLFANPVSPLEIEIGSGKGLFLATAAEDHPERNFLGVEIAGKYARFAASKLARRGLSNAVMVHGDGVQLLRDDVPDASVAAVHVYFPDPWWKKRHRKRRVVNPVLLEQVQRVLVCGGQFHLWTDVLEYYDASMELIAECPELSGPFAVPETPAEHDLDYRTHFERRMRQHELPVYRSRFERRRRD